MAKYNKNIASVIIIFSLICLVIALFIPKTSKNIKIVKSQSFKDSHISLNPFRTTSPFKSERISVIRIDGVISDTETSLFRDLTSSAFALETIRKLTKDENVKAIVIRVNSPGGTVAASQELYKAIKDASKKKPTIITMGDVAASGGYYIAAAADAIFANPGTITGSIGVITSYLNVHQLFSMIGVEGITLKAGKYKDIGSPTKPLTEEERKILQNLLNDSYNQFIADVAKGRNMKLIDVKKHAEGLIYTGKQAKKAGLVDFIGDYYKAINYARKLAKKRFPELAKKYKYTEIPIEETWKGGSLFDILVGALYKGTGHEKLINSKLLKTYSYSRFQPLWLMD